MDTIRKTKDGDQPEYIYSMQSEEGEWNTSMTMRKVNRSSMYAWWDPSYDPEKPYNSLQLHYQKIKYAPQF